MGFRCDIFLIRSIYKYRTSIRDFTRVDSNEVSHCSQQLAALLIARQVIGNLKESAVPYLIEQLRLARLSFEMFGALSPSEARSPPGEATGVPNQESVDAADEDKESKGKQPRTVSQAELESSLYRVGHPTNSLLSDVAFKV